MSRSEIRRNVTKLSACSRLKGRRFVADSTPGTSPVLRKIKFILRFRYFNKCRCIHILFDANFPRHSKSPRRLHFDNENEYINFFSRDPTTHTRSVISQATESSNSPLREPRNFHLCCWCARRTESNTRSCTGSSLVVHAVSV